MRIAIFIFSFIVLLALIVRLIEHLTGIKIYGIAILVGIFVSLFILVKLKK